MLKEATEFADVVLINPALINFAEKRIPVPTGLLAVGSFLDYYGYNVKLINQIPYHAAGDNSYLSLIGKEIKDAFCVGFSVMTDQIKYALLLSKFVTERDPSIPIIWGGVHPTLFPQSTCEDPLVDIVVMGEGEETMLELLGCFEKGVKIDDVRGIAYKDKNKVKINQLRENLDIEKLPSPVWHLLEMRWYIEGPVSPPYPKKRVVRSLQLNTSRGCPYRCTFCINSIIPSNRVWRTQNAQRVLDELEFVTSQFNLEFIWFRDENFFVSKRRIKEICEGIRKRIPDLKWGANVRCDYFNQEYLNEPFLSELKKSGCIYLTPGAESGSNRILKLIKKDITVTDILESARLLSKYDIVPLYGFMFGLPDETLDEMKLTMRLIEHIKEICPQAHFALNIFRPYPGSELYEEAKRFGFKEPRNLREWAKTSELFGTTGYISRKGAKWITNSDFAFFMASYFHYTLRPIDQILDDNVVTTAIAALIAKLRRRTEFYQWSYELDIGHRILDHLRHLMKLRQRKPRNLSKTGVQG